MAGWKLNWQDYYAILELDRTANIETIKKKYRKLAFKYHPDVCQDEDAHEKITLINEAYEVLGNNEAKKEYDAVWDARHNGTYVDPQNGPVEENNVSYDDVKNHYTAEERRYAKKVALKKIIEEELQKSESIINAKSEVIFSAYSENLEKREYYNTVKELIDIGFEFINNLTSLLSEAYKYDLLEEEELIKQTIEYLEQELKSIPLNPNDAKVYVEESLFKQSVEQKIIEELDTNKNIIDKLKSLLICTYQRQITHLDYRSILTSIFLEAKTNISHLRELFKISESLNLKDINGDITRALSQLNGQLISMPRDYDSAVKAGEQELLKEKIKEAIQGWNKYENKINKIIKILLKHPDSWRYEDLYNYGISILDDYITELNGVKSESQSLDSISSINHKKVKGLSDKAIELYKSAETLHRKADSIYAQKMTRVGFDSDDIITLSKSAASIWDKGEALELLVKAEELIGTMTCVKEIDQEYKCLCQQLTEIMSKIISIKEEFKNKYKLSKVNPYAKFTDVDYINKIKQLDKKIVSKLLSIIFNTGAGSLTTYLTLNEAGIFGKDDDKSILLIFFLGFLSIGLLGRGLKSLPGIIQILQEKGEVKEFFKNHQSAGKTYIKI